MPIDCILLVKVYRSCEISNCLVILEEAVPYETSTIIRWGILWIKLNNAIKVLKGELKPVSTDLFSHST